MAVRVLLVDDAEEARTMLADRLRRLEEVDLIAAARSEGEAADVLRRSQPDVVLVDLHSHHWNHDGVTLFSRLRKLTSAAIVVMTSFMTDERWRRLKAAGVDECLLKRVDSEGLENELVALGTGKSRGRPASKGIGEAKFGRH